MPSILVFTTTSVLHITFIVVQKPCQGNLRKFQVYGESRFGGSEKYFLKIPKWQHKLVQDHKQRKLVSCFLINAAKTFIWAKRFREH